MYLLLKYQHNGRGKKNRGKNINQMHIRAQSPQRLCAMVDGSSHYIKSKHFIIIIISISISLMYTKKNEEKKTTSLKNVSSIQKQLSMVYTINVLLSVCLFLF